MFRTSCLETMQFPEYVQIFQRNLSDSLCRIPGEKMLFLLMLVDLARVYIQVWISKHDV